MNSKELKTYLNSVITQKKAVTTKEQLINIVIFDKDIKIVFKGIFEPYLYLFVLQLKQKIL